MRVGSSSPPRPRAATALDVAAAILVGVLFLVASVRFGGSVSGDELDPAWTMVLRWASLQGLRWGSDIAFTYGPLGYLYPLNANDPASYASFVALQIALAAAAGFLFANAWLAQRWLERLVLASVVLFAAPLLTADPVWLSMPVFALAGLQAHAAAGRRRALWLLLVVAALYLATILLIKMSGLLLVLACWLAGATVLWHARQRRPALAWLLLMPAFSLALWILSGQHLVDLWPFMATVLEISRGYTAAMGISPPLLYDLYGLAVLGGIGAAGLWAAWRARHDLGRLACILLCGLALFVAWRSGFTRADTHIAIFALTAWLLLPLLAALAPAPPPRLRALGLLLVLAVVPLADRCFNPGPTHRAGELAVASLGMLPNNLRMLTRPLTYRPLLDAALDQERQRLDLPQIRAAIGKHSVDLLGTQQGVVIINGFNYRPAPVFQGYGAYTPRLQQLNAAAYSGPARRDFVLLAYSPIDGNLPSSENALAFSTLYLNYHPVLVEKSYLLLRADETAQAPPSVPASGWRTAGWGEWTALPSEADQVSLLAVRNELSVAGKLVATVLREPSQLIELELADGTTQRFRLGRGAAPGGFLVSPLLQSLDDYIRLFAGGELPAVRRFRLLPQSEAMAALFSAQIQWNLVQLPRRPLGELPAALRDFFFPGFSHQPLALPAAAKTMEVEGRRVLFLHSPAQLRFQPGPGRYVVSGEIGIVPNAFTTPDCARSDGVQLEIGGSTGEGLTYPYNPFADAALRPARRFELGPVESGEDGLLRLEIGAGAAGNHDCDWSYLRDLRIRAAGESPPAVP